MSRFVATLRDQQADARKVDEAIARNLAWLGHGRQEEKQPSY